MPRKCLIFAQDKGGSGKSTAVRAAAELVADATVLEIESSRRLLELGDRAKFCRMRASPRDIDRTGGKAARAEFDEAVNYLLGAPGPVIVDVGANTAASFFPLLVRLRPDFADAEIELGVVVPVTTEPASIAEAEALLPLADDFAVAKFVIENRMRGSVNERLFTALAANAIPSVFEEQIMEEEAAAILMGGGLASLSELGRSEVRSKFSKKFGPALGGRIRHDLMQFRAAALESVRAAAEWLST